jgi:hypothetical protein
MELNTKEMRQQILVAALCALIVLGSLAAILWVLVTGQIEKQGLDALFLLLVCLLMALIFLPIPLQALRQGVLKDMLKRKEKKAVEEEKRQAAPVVSQKPQERS